MAFPIGAAFASALASKVVGSAFGGDSQPAQNTYQPPTFQGQSWEKMLQLLYGFGGSGPGGANQNPVSSDPILQAFRLGGRQYG